MATINDRHVQLLRALGNTSNKVIAATRQRRLEICQPVKVTAFIATPPVEKRSAPIMILSLAFTNSVYTHYSSEKWKQQTQSFS